jgi:pimeloyl-ACP methyl ester carboxylesterase
VNPAGFARQLAAVYVSGDRTEALRSLDVPTLVVHGEEDPLIPMSGGRATAAAIPGAELWTIPGMGHDLPRAMWPELIRRIDALAEPVDSAQAA